MSSTFILMGLLVLAAFALGVLVGWLTWTSARADGDQPTRRPVRLRPMTRGLPDWEVEETPNHSTGVAWKAVEPPLHRPRSGPDDDVLDDDVPATDAPVDDADANEVTDPAVETTMLLGPRSNGDSGHPARTEPNPDPS